MKGEVEIKVFLKIIAIGLLTLWWIPTPSKAATLSLQEQIDAAKSGDVIVLDEGIYRENIVIDKSIHLQGNSNVIFQQQGASPIIIIEADGVVIENINLEYVDSSKDSPAILLHGNNNQLHEIKINTNGYGIRLDEAHHNTLSRIEIVGEEDLPIKDRQHGIGIWNSHENSVDYSTISNMKDGIYIERSNNITLAHNLTFASRYGYHLMFTKDNKLEENESFDNYSGMMIMGTRGTNVSNNILRDNQINSQSLGLLIFDTYDAKITGNIILNNRIGIFLESAEGNTFSDNKLERNYIGLQFKDAQENQLVHNAFIGNVVQGQAVESSNNNLNGNYWGDHLGLDFNGDNLSNLPYKVNPFFLSITNRFPVFQLLFESPGLDFLEQLIYTPDGKQLIDFSPLMENPLIESKKNQKNYQVLVLSLFLMILSTIAIYQGVKKDEKI